MTSMRSETLAPSELSEEDVAVWDGLCMNSPDLSVAFLTYPYARAAEDAFSDVRVCRIARENRAVGFFPYQFRSPLHRRLGIGQRLAGDMSDYFGIVAAPDCKLDPKTLMRLCGLRALLFTHLDESQSAFGLSGTAFEPGHLIDFPKGGTSFWEERRAADKKFVADTERRERKLVRDVGPLRFEIQSPDIKADLQKLISAKREQYSRTNADDAFGTESAIEFLRSLSAMDHPLCTGLLSTLYAGDVWIASHFGLRCNQTLHYWFPVYNPQMSAFGPGRLLLKCILDFGNEHGISRIDRGAGDTVAKRDFATSQHKFSRGLWARGDIVSLAYKAGLSASWKIRALVPDGKT